MAAKKVRGKRPMTKKLDNQPGQGGKPLGGIVSQGPTRPNPILKSTMVKSSGRKR